MNIGNHKFSLGLVTFDVKIVPKKNIKGNWGRINYNKEEILIADHLSDYQTKQTLLHEILHAIDRRTGDRMNEQQIDGIAHGLMEAFSANPWLIELFDDRLTEIGINWTGNA